MHRLKYARVERERRFLLAALPDEASGGLRHRIEDRYLTGTRLRLRRVTGSDGSVLQRKLTQKIEIDPSHRVTTTVDLDADEYAHLARLPAAPLVKTRHHHHVGGIDWGIDVFGNGLTGLVLAEAEASSDEVLDGVALPGFAHCEVTDCVELSGGRLATADPAVALDFARRRLAAPRRPIGTTPVAPSIGIRPFDASDPPALAAAFAAIGWRSKPEALFRRYLDEQTSDARTLLVAERGGARAGYVTIAWSADYVPFRSAGIPEIEDLNVLPAHRGHGVAGALLDEAEARIAPLSREAGIAVGLHPGYNVAQRLYARRGYVPDGRGVTHRGVAVAEGAIVPLDDDLVLHLVKAL